MKCQITHCQKGVSKISKSYEKFNLLAKLNLRLLEKHSREPDYPLLMTTMKIMRILFSTLISSYDLTSKSGVKLSCTLALSSLVHCCSHHNMCFGSSRLRDSILQTKKDFNQKLKDVWADKLAESEKIKRKNEDIRKVVAEMKLGGTEVKFSLTLR